MRYMDIGELILEYWNDWIIIINYYYGYKYY